MAHLIKLIYNKGSKPNQTKKGKPDNESPRKILNTECKVCHNLFIFVKKVTQAGT